jgi:splicing factor 3A subunit 3
MSYVEEHFLIEKFRLIREEQEALLSILSKELSKMPELGLFPTELDEMPQVPRIGSISSSMLSTRLHKARLMAEHLIKRIIERYMDFEEKLAKSLNDPDSRSLMRAQINELLDGGYECLEQHKKAILEYHRRNETEGIIKDSFEEYSKIIDSYRLDEEDLDLMFSGLENHGRFIDLYKFYEDYLNLSGSHIGYLAFLKILSKLSLDFDKKMNSNYSLLINEMIAYFNSFIERAFPLVFDISEGLDEHMETFEKNWNEGIYPEDWTNPIAELSLVQPKSDLYCLPCQHLFTNKSVYEAHFKGKKHIKASEKCKEGYVEAEAVEKVLQQYKQTKLDSIKGVASLESKFKWFINLLGSVIDETIQDLERKQAMTPEEIQREEALIAQQDEEFYLKNVKGDSSESAAKKKKKLTDYKDELPQELFNGGVYNPLKLPLDWDGKPIPYWLWKLHGLGTKYPCEVCGGYEYAGRKAFDSHFSEWRHSHGLKCLGIPSTKHFFHVTKISEAISLWDKLKTQARTEIFRPEAMEEVEDHLGNVYLKKTFEDLQKQGLI